ncbi:aldo/keto reductase, partial [Burkholderia multivorans]|uniref:aldo/keto reductase n=1 Tax=Burkholderia multivorans TaxID=87883 RepID=UPI0015EC2750
AMHPGPYGGPGGSRKYLLSSLDASLARLGLDYVDIFYSHRPDASTPLEETIGALDTAVRSGRALYAGISSYSAADTARAAQIADDLGTPLLIHQPSYSMLNRWIEDDGLLDTTIEHGLGVIAFSPLKVYEYMAAGLPTVASAVGALPDLIAGTGTGILVPPDDLAALTEALQSLIDDPA